MKITLSCLMALLLLMVASPTTAQEQPSEIAPPPPEPGAHESISQEPPPPERPEPPPPGDRPRGARRGRVRRQGAEPPHTRGSRSSFHQGRFARPRPEWRCRCSAACPQRTERQASTRSPVKLFRNCRLAFQVSPEFKPQVAAAPEPRDSSPASDEPRLAGYASALAPPTMSSSSIVICVCLARLYCRVSRVIISLAASVAAFIATIRASCSLTIASVKH